MKENGRKNAEGEEILQFQKSILAKNATVILHELETLLYDRGNLLTLFGLAEFLEGIHCELEILVMDLLLPAEEEEDAATCTGYTCAHTIQKSSAGRV